MRGEKTQQRNKTNQTNAEMDHTDKNENENEWNLCRFLILYAKRLIQLK